MHILHTSDWHLGKSLNSQSLIEDQRHFLNQLKKILEKAESEGNGFRALIISGDIYDRSIPSSEAVLLLDSFLSEICASLKNLHIFLISGNHDSATRLSFGTSFFEKENIHICCNTQSIESPVIIEDNKEALCVYQIPYLYPGSLSDSTNKEEQKQILKTQQELFNEATKRIFNSHQQKHEDKLCLVNAHLFASGAKDGDIDYERIGNSEVVDASIFDKFDYTALGHIHAFQKINEKGNCFYSGSPLAYAFDEQSKKYFLDVELKKNLKPDVKKIPVNPLHKVTKLIKPWSALFGSESDRELIEKCRNDYLQVICTDKINISSPLEILRGIFPNMLSFKIIEREGNNSENSSPAKRKLLDCTTVNKAELAFDEFMKEIHSGETFDQQMLQKEKELFMEIATKIQW